MLQEKQGVFMGRRKYYGTTKRFQEWRSLIINSIGCLQLVKMTVYDFVMLKMG